MAMATADSPEGGTGCPGKSICWDWRMTLDYDTFEFCARWFLVV
jgi:hypothetical protein